MDSRHPEILEIKRALDGGRAPLEFEPVMKEISSQLADALSGVDLAIAHNVCSLHKNLALTAALQSLFADHVIPRLVLWHHDLAWTTPRYRSELHPGFPWDLLRTHWGATHVTISAFRKRELSALMDLPPQAITVVPNGIDIPEFLKLEPLTQTLAEKLRLLDAAPLLLLPVRLTPRKNVELALRVLAELRRTFPSAALVVTGPPGPHNPANAEYLDRLARLRDELGLQASAHLLTQIHGRSLPDAVIADLYRMADALVLPSFEEGFGIPLLEAAMVRLPVFCSDIPPLRDLAQDEAIYFSPDSEPARVARMIEDTLSNSPTFRFGVRARSRFDWARIYEQAIAPILVGG
jgi:glycosyltransferase involved in cell wall biosynthesis